MLNNMEKCTVLARAMFPTAVIEPSSGNGVNIRIYDKPNETRSWYDFNPYESAEDSRALVAWMAMLPRDKQHQFELDLRCEMNIELPYALAVLTLDLPIIADAAWRAIAPERSTGS